MGNNLSKNQSFVQDKSNNSSRTILDFSKRKSDDFKDDINRRKSTLLPFVES